MAVNFLQVADLLQAELQKFFRVLRHRGDEVDRGAAIERLHAVVTQIEALADDPGQEWTCLATEQRWGYLRVVSYLGTATQALKNAGGSGPYESR